MSKPRDFLSSTCYDLRDARAVIEDHLSTLGHEPVRSDSTKFGIALKKHSHDACLDQVDLCDYFILIIGGRRGGTYIGSEKSITNEEYNRARKGHKPIITFVRQDVMQVFSLYKKNPQNDFSSVVDDVRVFQFLEMVTSSSEDNWVREFNSVADIKESLTAQFAFVALQYSRGLIQDSHPSRREEQETPLSRFPRNLPRLKADGDDGRVSMIRGLRTVHSVISKIQSSSAMGKSEKLKLIWLLGRYGEIGDGSNIISLSEPKFRQYAWGITKGRKVFEQIADFGVTGEYPEPDNHDAQPRVLFRFEKDDDAEAVQALQTYIRDLLKAGDDESAFVQFKRAYMGLYE